MVNRQQMKNLLPLLLFSSACIFGFDNPAGETDVAPIAIDAEALSPDARLIVLPDAAPGTEARPDAKPTPDIFAVDSQDDLGASDASPAADAEALDAEPALDSESPDAGCITNPCGGCGQLAIAPGEPCGVCGLTECSALDQTICVEAFEMVAQQGFCVDRYEATAWSSEFCAGLQYGAAGDDYPSGFPKDIESAGLAGDAQTEAVYACSAGSITPSRWLTWKQAKRACENSGKRLCTEDEWWLMCRTANNWVYPYGNTYEPDWCNTADAPGVDVALTGSFPNCIGGGVYDLGGNTATFLVGNDGVTCVGPRGGTYNNGLEYAQCMAVYWSCPNLDIHETYGFRCCRDRP
jgi:hypothetical protein